jgi:DNA gyrase/topoisomerase IV subunit A
MHENGYEWNKPYRKSARVVGDVIGKYHPHGDQSIYDALVRMAQSFSMRLPLVDGQGNFGSVDGDPPAAMRYTEVRLAKVANALLEDLDKETVDFQENYDNTEREPSVLPARFPNLLANGAGGIAVGMATNIPPHNLGEIIDACIALIDKPELTVEQLLDIVPGPDFPTGGIILGRAGIRQAFLTGRGSIVVRGRVSQEPLSREREAIIVTEIPYQVNKTTLIEKIAELVRDGSSTRQMRSWGMSSMPPIVPASSRPPPPAGTTVPTLPGSGGTATTGGSVTPGSRLGGTDGWFEPAGVSPPDGGISGTSMTPIWGGTPPGGKTHDAATRLPL